MNEWNDDRQNRAQGSTKLPPTKKNNSGVSQDIERLLYLWQTIEMSPRLGPLDSKTTSEFTTTKPAG